jgi:hypothetical protein
MIRFYYKNRMKIQIILIESLYIKLFKELVILYLTAERQIKHIQHKTINMF